MNRHHNRALTAITYILCAFLILPVVLIFAVSLTDTTYLTFPPRGLTLRWYLNVFENPRIIKALWVSVKVGFATAVLATTLGIIGGLYLSRSRNRGARLISLLFLAPLTVPVIVLAIGLLFTLTSFGLLRSFTAIVVGHVIITFPYVIRMIVASTGRSIEQLESAAAVLGANQWQTFQGVTFPVIRAGVVAGMLFSFLVSFNNVTITLFLSGARTQTLPVLMFNMTHEKISPELAALSTVLVLSAYGIMLILEHQFGIYRLLKKRRL